MPKQGEGQKPVKFYKTSFMDGPKHSFNIPGDFFVNLFTCFYHSYMNLPQVHQKIKDKPCTICGERFARSQVIVLKLTKILLLLT